MRTRSFSVRIFLSEFETGIGGFCGAGATIVDVA